jgi:hypothetical protein
LRSRCCPRGSGRSGEASTIQTDGGFGFRVIRGLAAEIGASLEIVSPGIGLSFRLLLPAMAGGKLS